MTQLLISHFSAKGEAGDTDDYFALIKAIECWLCTSLKTQVSRHGGSTKTLLCCLQECTVILQSLIIKPRSHQLVKDFFAAGAETTSTTLGWMLYFMLKYPDVQRKIRVTLFSEKKL